MLPERIPTGFTDSRLYERASQHNSQMTQRNSRPHANGHARCHVRILEKARTHARLTGVSSSAHVHGPDFLCHVPEPVMRWVGGSGFVKFGDKDGGWRSILVSIIFFPPFFNVSYVTCIAFQYILLILFGRWDIHLKQM